MEYPLLLEFLDTRLEAALDQERFNRQTIHLYGVAIVGWRWNIWRACWRSDFIIRTRTR